MRPAAAFAIAALTLPAAASAYAVRLDVARCAPLALPDVATLGPEWPALAAYVQRCAVAGPDGRVALSVDIVRLDRAYAAHLFNNHPDWKVPNPILRDATGRPVGTLPEGFPVDPPGALRVRFADWIGGLPRRIDLYEAGESAVSPHALAPMQWDAKVRGYR